MKFNLLKAFSTVVTTVTLAISSHATKNEFSGSGTFEASDAAFLGGTEFSFTSVVDFSQPSETPTNPNLFVKTISDIKISTAGFTGVFSTAGIVRSSLSIALSTELGAGPSNFSLQSGELPFVSFSDRADDVVFLLTIPGSFDIFSSSLEDSFGSIGSSPAVFTLQFINNGNPYRGSFASGTTALTAVSSVPETGSAAAILGLGLIGMIGWKRFRQGSAQV